jgi:Right handed beta helix region
MKPFASAVLALLFVVAIFIPSAQATTTANTWFGLNGSDSNNCSSPTTPCLTLAGAYAETAPGGTINCLDNTAIISSATLTITHSVTIDCRSVTVVLMGSSVDVITVSAGVNDVVILRGLEFESYVISGGLPGLTGVHLISAGALHIENCTFRNFTTAGIEFTPTNAAKLYVANSTVQHNATGVMINPGSGGSVDASFDTVAITENTGGGLKAQTTTSGPVTVDISNSTISYNAGNGLNAVSGAGGANMLNLSHDVIASNGSAGVQANGASSAALIDTTLLDSNTAGATSAVGGGRLLTYGNNRIVGSAGSGFTGPAALN